jgi:NitT/TauT family transport system permease protein
VSISSIESRAVTPSLGARAASTALSESRSGWLATLLVSGATAVWAAATAVTLLVPDVRPLYTTAQIGAITALLTALFAAGALAGIAQPRVRAFVRALAPWFLVLGIAALAWQLITAKHKLLPLPYFPPPQTILDAFESDWSLLLESIFYSMRLLVLGVGLGAATGFLTGIAMGWSKRAHYWINPILRTIGPIPATAWLPLAFVLLPTAFGASIFILALATWFPVTFLTWAGVVSVSRSYYDVARTLGARDRFLVWKVAVPAAMPSVFVGLFMGLGNSFVTLLAAEMLGVKAGLGWYITWAQGWAAYPKVYAALAIIAALFSGLILLLFRVRDNVLSWQKGLVRW